MTPFRSSGLPLNERNSQAKPLCTSGPDTQFDQRRPARPALRLAGYFPGAASSRRTGRERHRPFGKRRMKKPAECRATRPGATFGPSPRNFSCGKSTWSCNAAGWVSRCDNRSWPRPRNNSSTWSSRTFTASSRGDRWACHGLNGLRRQEGLAIAAELFVRRIGNPSYISKISFHAGVILPRHESRSGRPRP